MNYDSISPKILADSIIDEFNQHAISVKSVYLFGSRANGTAKPDSDWDFLVITSTEIERSLRRKILTGIRKRFVFEFNIDCDLLVLPENMVSSAREDKGRILFYAIRDGLAI